MRRDLLDWLFAIETSKGSIYRLWKNAQPPTQTIDGYPRLLTAASLPHSVQNHKVVSAQPNQKSQGGRDRKLTQCAFVTRRLLPIPSILHSWSFENRCKQFRRSH